MFCWLTKRRRKGEQLAATLDLAATLKESQELIRSTLAICETQNQLNQQLAAQLAEVRAENSRLWTALGAPAEVQQLLAVGFSEAEANKLKDAPRA